MTPREWLLLGSLTAIGCGFLLLAWALHRWTAPAGRHHIGRGETVHDCNEHEPYDQLREDVEVIRPAEPLPPLRSAAEVAEVEDKTAWIGDMKADMEVKDNLGDPLELEVVTTLDRLQAEGVPAFQAAVDAALAKFDAPVPSPHRVSNTEFVHRAELDAWAKELTGSFRTIPLSSETQEIPAATIAAILSAGAPK